MVGRLQGFPGLAAAQPGPHLSGGTASGGDDASACSAMSSASIRDRGPTSASNVWVAFGTDAGTFVHEENWREFPMMVSTGTTPLRALQAATSVAAELLGSTTWV
jgi:hypothetical protein